MSGISNARNVLRAPALSKSKLSVHTGGIDGPVSDFLKNSQPQLVKFLDDFGSAATAKSMVPGITVICRIYLPNQPETGDPVAAAQAWWSTNQATIQGNPACDYWEGYNEPAVGSGSQMAWMSSFEVERQRLLNGAGLRAAIGCFSTGTPDVTNATLMALFNPALEAAHANGNILAVHEYASPFVWSCFDNSTGEGWFTGRYRKWYRQYLEPAGLGDLPLAITENGIDNVGGACGSPSLGGWNEYCGYWQQHGFGSDCNAAYVQQLAWYDSIMREDDYVLGSTIFTADLSGWSQYDVESALPDLANYMRSVQ